MMRSVAGRMRTLYKVKSYDTCHKPQLNQSSKIKLQYHFFWWGGGVRRKAQALSSVRLHIPS